MIPGASVISSFLRKYRSLLSLGVATLLAELAYAILNLSALPMYVSFVLKQQAALGVVISAFLLTEALSRPWFGALGDRIGRKPLLIAGPLVTAITAYLTIKLQGPYAVYGLLVLKAIDGLGSGALWMNAFAAVGDVVEEEHHSAAMSMLNVTYMSGIALGFLFGGLVNQAFRSYLASFYLVSILLVVSVVIMSALLPKKIGGTFPEHSAPGDHVELTTLEEQPAEFKLSNIWRSFRDVPDMLALASVVFLGIGMLMPVVKLYAIQHLDLSETAFGLAVAPIAAAMGGFAVPMGRLGDKYGRCVAVCWGLLVSAIALWGLALFRSTIIAAGAGIVIGLGFTVAFPAWMALVASSTSAKRRGEIIGAVGAVQGLAAIIGTALGAYIYSNDRLSFPRLGLVNYNVPFWWSAILMTAGTVMAFTWMCNRNCSRDVGGGMKPWHRKMVILSSIAGLVALLGWIGCRYAQPVSPDRVAWQWIQQLYRGKPDNAVKYTLRTGPQGWNGDLASREYSELYVRYHEKMDALWYTVFAPVRTSDGRVEVKVKFVFRGNKYRYGHIVLCKPDREWKVCGVRRDNL
ncbi:MAG: MFS transporter [Armatimonadetes bacterium]|nr:MFS transporter [Armatimonadota bacterium]